MAAGPATEIATQVLVRADRDATYGAVRATLASARAAGFSRLSLVILREDGR